MAGTSGRKILFAGGAIAIAVAAFAVQVSAATPDRRVARIAELEIDPAQVEAYQTALRQEIATSIRLEPGVLALYAVAVKGHPEQVRLFELYRDQAAYNAHLRTPHFLTYKQATAGMVKSLHLIETDPVLLGAKER